MRLRDGRRVTRRFAQESALRDVVAWLEGLEPDGEGFDLASNFPRMLFGAAELERSLIELGLHPTAMLFLQEREEEEEDEEEATST